MIGYSVSEPNLTFALDAVKCPSNNYSENMSAGRDRTGRRVAARFNYN